MAAAVGTKSHGGVTYNTVATTITGLMPAGSDGVNHGMNAVRTLSMTSLNQFLLQVSRLTVLSPS